MEYSKKHISKILSILCELRRRGKTSSHSNLKSYLVNAARSWVEQREKCQPELKCSIFLPAALSAWAELHNEIYISEGSIRV